jgi:hypothetical protein
MSFFILFSGGCSAHSQGAGSPGTYVKPFEDNFKKIKKNLSNY